MPNHVRVLNVKGDDLAELERRTRAKSAPARDVQRARIVLLSAQGYSGVEIAERVGCSEPTVIRWRTRYAQRGLAGLDDRPRTGAPPTITPAQLWDILWRTVNPPPVEEGITHWSSRLLARKVGVDHSTIARVWARYQLKPWRLGTFKFSTDPELEAKVIDVVGLYMNPPDKAVVVCVDEKTQIQALDRTQPMLPVRPGLSPKRTHDYKRNGTTTLFAALEVATGKVVDACYPRHRHQEFLRFLKQAALCLPAGQAARGLRQLRHAQAREHPQVAEAQQAGHVALHADVGVVDEPGGGVLFDHLPSGDPPRQLRLRRGPHCGDPPVHRRLERTLRAVRVDQACRGDSRQDQH